MEFEIKKTISNLFLEYFSQKNYTFHPEANLITSDKSLLFTNSAIIPLKKYIRENNIPENGFYLKQPCLRLHGLTDPLTKSMAQERNFERFLGYFNMMGILVNKNKKNEIQSNILELLLDKYNIPESEIKVFAPENVEFIREIDKNLNVEYGSKDKSFYSWNYGEENLSGIGVTFSLLQKNKKFEEIGQIIQIKNNGKISGYEFGFGIETFLSRKNKDNSYNAWTISHCVPEKYKFKTALDFFSCLGTMCMINPALMNRKHRKEIRRLSNKIIKLENLFEIPLGQIDSYINKFINLEFNDFSKEGEIKKLLNYARGKQKNEI